MSHSDPAQELASLSRALAREVQRRKWHGQRVSTPPKAPDPERTPNPQASASLAAAPQPGASNPKAPLPTTQQVAQGAKTWQELAAAVASCQACDLCHSRKTPVFARGEGTVSVAFLNLAPGAQEEASGSPLAGPGEEMLDKIISQGMRLEPAKTALLSLVKCRPPQDRAPREGEIRTCAPFLERQIELLQPQVLIPLGEACAEAYLGRDPTGSSLQGRIHRPGGPAVVPTHHPQDLLQNPQTKASCWGHIQLAMGEMGLSPQA